MVEYFRDFRSLIILSLIVFTVVCLMNSYHKLFGITLFIVFIMRIATKKTKPQMSASNEYTSYMNAWIYDLKEAVKKNDRDEVTRIYQIIMNMIHSENMFQKNAVQDTVQDTVHDLISDNNVLQANTFSEPNYHVCA